MTIGTWCPCHNMLEVKCENDSSMILKIFYSGKEVMDKVVTASLGCRVYYSTFTQVVLSDMPDWMTHLVKYIWIVWIFMLNINTVIASFSCFITRFKLKNIVGRQSYVEQVDSFCYLGMSMCFAMKMSNNWCILLAF